MYVATPEERKLCVIKNTKYTLPETVYKLQNNPQTQ
jgi:hypothetical protein